MSDRRIIPYFLILGGLFAAAFPCGISEMPALPFTVSYGLRLGIVAIRHGEHP